MPRIPFVSLIIPLDGDMLVWVEQDDHAYLLRTELVGRVYEAFQVFEPQVSPTPPTTRELIIIEAKNRAFQN